MEVQNWGCTLDGQYEIISLTEEYIDGCMNVMREAFFKYETVSIACELPKHPIAIKELEEMCLYTCKQGISLIAIEKATGEVVAVSINIFEVPSDSDAPNYYVELQKKSSTPSAKCLLQFMIDMANEFDIFSHFNVDCLIEIMFLATLKNHCGHGIAKKLFQCTIEMAKQLKNGQDVRKAVGCELKVLQSPKLVTALCSSFITQKITKDLGFINLKMVNFNKWSFNGKTFAEVIGPTTTATSIDCLVL